jgi:hypothetical protein
MWPTPGALQHVGRSQTLANVSEYEMPCICPQCSPPGGVCIRPQTSQKARLCNLHQLLFSSVCCKYCMLLSALEGLVLQAPVLQAVVFPLLLLHACVLPVLAAYAW